MIIPISLEHVFVPGANPVDNARSLRNLLEYMVKENMDWLQGHPETPSLYRSGTTYARTVVWEPIPSLYKRRLGDCKSLATALCADYRMQGIPCRPVFRFITNPDETTDYHILVQTVTGWEDPSKILGMGHHADRYFGPFSGGDDEFLEAHRLRM